MGVTASTPTNLVIGAGDVYVDNAILGASIGDNKFAVNRTYYTPDLNGVKGSLLGTVFIQNSEGVLTCAIPEVSAAIMSKMWPASNAGGGGPNATVLDEDDTVRVATTDYHDWRLQVPGVTLTFGYEVDNGLNMGSLEFNQSDSSVAAPTAEIHSFWDPADVSVSPHRIRITGTGS